MARPQFAFTVIRTSYEYEGPYNSVITEVVGRTYFASLAGARFACRVFGESDETISGRIEELKAGKVYNHLTDRWEEGLAYQPWYPEWKTPVTDPFDDMPF